MEAVNLKRELQKYVEIGDEAFLKELYKTAQNYINQKKLDRLILQGEDDIAAGKTHDANEVQGMIRSWTNQ